MLEKKKIGFLCHPYHRGGVTRWMADAAIDYSRKNYDVYFVTIEPAKEFISGRGRETMLQLLQKTKNNIHISSEKAGREFEFGLPAHNACRYQQIVLNNIPLGTPIILSDDSTVWQAAVGLHNSYPIVGVLHADESHYYELAQKYQKEVSIFVCVSSRVHTLIAQKSPGIEANRIFTIPCGIDLPAPVTRRKPNDILQLVYVGRISDYQKRTSDTAKIAALLKKNDIPFHLTIIGDGMEPKIALQHQVTELELEEAVTFTGWLSQAKVHEYLTKSDILILTSDFEGMPISMMEGLAAGCAFAGTRVSGIEDYEHHPLAKDCFRVFGVGDIADAVNKIQQLAIVPLTARNKAARSLAEDQFSMQVCLDKYDHAIDTILIKKYVSTKIHISLATILKSRSIAMLRSFKMALK